MQIETFRNNKLGYRSWIEELTTYTSIFPYFLEFYSNLMKYVIWKGTITIFGHPLRIFKYFFSERTIF